MNIKNKIDVYLNQNKEIDVEIMKESKQKLDLMVKAIADHVSLNVNKVKSWFNKFKIGFNDAVDIVNKVEKKRDWKGLHKVIVGNREYVLEDVNEEKIDEVTKPLKFINKFERDKIFKMIDDDAVYTRSGKTEMIYFKNDSAKRDFFKKIGKDKLQKISDYKGGSIFEGEK